METQQSEFVEAGSNGAMLAAATMPAIFADAVSRNPDKLLLEVVEQGKPALPARSLTYAEFARGVRCAAAWLRRAGLAARSRLLLLAPNSPEWQMFSLATQLLRAEPAALFSILDAAPALEIAGRVAPNVIFVSDQRQWAKLAPGVERLIKSGLRAVVSLEPLGVALPEQVREATVVQVMAGAPLEEDEARGLARWVEPEDPFLLLFTSGSTGKNKGVRLAQRTMVHTIRAAADVLGMTPADRSLHFLPFGHIAGQCQFMCALGLGQTMIQVAAREDIQRAMSLGPSFLFLVPLVYERIWRGVEAQIQARPWPLRSLLQAALAAAARVACDGSTRLVDRLLAALARRTAGKKLREKLGGNVRALFAGGAPTPPAMQRFFEGLGIPYIEVYGMSETAGLISSQSTKAQRKSGSAGRLAEGLELRIAPDGELLVRGPRLMSGYLEDDDNKDALTKSGFFRTGDLADLSATGSIRIVGRKKHLFVLSTGKKLAPEPIEQAIGSAPPFQGAVLIGDGRAFIAVIVFVAQATLDELRASGEVEKPLLEKAHAALGAFSDWERPKRLIAIAGTPQDVPEIMTPSMKVKREAVDRWLAKEIAAIYQERGHAKEK